MLLLHTLYGGSMDDVDAVRKTADTSGLITTSGQTFVVVKFNAWTFGSESLWAALIVMIQDEVRRSAVTRAALRRCYSHCYSTVDRNIQYWR
jgi:hypothetical protein